MAKLKPWYQVVTPREDLRENRPMDASEFAVHLDHIRTGRETVSKDYSDPARFFDRTYMTESLLELCSQVVRRLSGVQVETSAVYNMATQFGGGKTHSETTAYHLATNGEKAKSWKGVDRILAKAGVPQVPKADVAVFVGTEFDVIQGRGGNGEPVRKTPWGEMAWQLGGEKAFAAVAQHDAQAVAPAGDALRAMLPCGPTLILMDELMNYVSRGRKTGQRDQFFDFLQNLSEEARARKNLVLCVSIPASELEMNPDDVRDHAALKKLTEWSTKGVRDAFYSSPQLPRLLDGDTIKRTIADGVTEGVLGYARKDDRGRVELIRFQASLGETEVEIDDGSFILKKEDAAKLLDPPRLAQIAVSPVHVALKPGERASFSVSARDQYGQPIAAPATTWSAKGGTFSDDGVFTAGEDEGQYNVRVTTDGLKAIAEVRIAKEPVQTKEKQQPGKQLIRWTGDVPPQKWMNFYTKVLSRFASTPGLKLRVSFEVPAEGDQGGAKANETKSGLKELGLDDDVTVG